MTNINDEPTDTQGDLELKTPLSRLKVLLNSPDEKSEKWQEDAARQIALVAISLVNKDTNDIDYITGLIIIQKSQTAGVRASKKIAINISRYKDKSPPDLSQILNEEDKKIILSLFNKIKAEWCRNYIYESFLGIVNVKELTPILIKWLALNEQSAADFLNSIFKILTSDHGIRYATAVLKESSKHFRRWESISAKGMAVDYREFVKQILQLTSFFKNDKKIINEIFIILQKYTDETVSVCPDILSEPNFISAIRDFQKTAREFKLETKWNSLLEKYSKVVVSIILSHIQQYGDAGTDYWRHRIKFLFEVYRKLERYLEMQLIHYPALEGLFNAPRVASDSNLIYKLEHEFANLLPLWRNYTESLTEPEKVESLNNLIMKAAFTIGVENFGVVGAVVDYDPVEHNLYMEAKAPVVTVTIVRPGVRVARKDGVIKIILPAMVE